MAAIETNIDSNVSSTKTYILRPGEKFILPAGAIVDSIVIDGSIDVNSSCNNLPAPTSYKCGFLALVLDRDENTGHSMNEQDTYLQSLKVGNNLYTINRLVVIGDGNNSVSQSKDVLNSHIPDQVLFSFTNIRRDTLNARQVVYLYFKTPATLFSTIEAQILNQGIIQYSRPYEAACNLYEYGDSA